jgi:hypothetical protein
MRTREQFNMYIDWYKNIQKFSVEEKALLMDKMFGFYINHEVSDVPEHMVRLNVFWDSILPFMIKAEDKYQLTYNNRKEGIKKAQNENPKLNKTRQAGIEKPAKQVSNETRQADIEEPANQASTSTSTSTLTSTLTETETSTSTETSTETETPTRPTSLTGAITHTLKEIESSILTPEFVTEQLNKGITADELKAKYPHSASVITDVYFDL